MWFAIDYRDTRQNGKRSAVGFCVEVEADSKAAALTKLREVLPESLIEPLSDDDGNNTDIDVRVYLYPEDLTEDDLEEIDDPREEED